MTTHRVKAPDGTTYDVTAPDGASDADVLAYVQSQHPDKSAPADPAPSARSQSYGATDLAASKATFGLGDKAAALGTAIGGTIRRALTGQPMAEHGQLYQAALADEQNAKSDYVAKHPSVDWATAPLGLLAGSPATSALSAVRAGVTGGAIAGGVQALGSARGDVGQQVGQVALGAGVGAAAGGVAAKVVPLAVSGAVNAGRSVVRRVGAAIAPHAEAVQTTADNVLQATVPVPNGTSNPTAPRRAGLPAPSRAQTLIADAIVADGNTPRSVGKMIADASDRGVPLSIADTGDNARGLAASVGRQPGASRTLMRDAVVSRQEGQTDRVQSAIGRDLGNVVDPHVQSQALLDTARRNAAPLYEKAYSQPVTFDEDTAALLARPSMKAALGNAKQIAAEEGRDPTALGFVTTENGDVTLPKAPSMQTMDYVKRGIDDVVEKYRDGTTGKLNLDTQGNAVNGTRAQLVQKLDAMNPDYAAARAAYAGPVRANAAMIKGRSALSKTASDITAETKDMTPFELDHYRLGVRTALSDKTESLVDGGDKTRALLGSPKKRGALAQVFGGEAGFDNFLTTLADEGRTSATYGAVNTGSATAGRLADDAGTTDAGLAGIALNAGVRTVTTSPVHNILHTIREINAHGAGEAGKVTRAELAAALSETDPEVLATALRAAQRVRAQTRLNGRGAAIRGRAAGAAAGRAGGAVSAALTGQ